jgi:hypothetical protein
MHTVLVNEITTAPLWFVSAAATELVESAAEQMPKWADVEGCLPPSPTGFAVIESKDKAPCAIQWICLPLPDEPTAILTTIYDSADDWRFSTVLSFVDDPEEREFERPVEHHIIRNRILALFALFRSPGILRSDAQQPDRPTRRRSQRAGIDLDATRVIYINGHERTGDGGTEGHEYQHRWIVSGHWKRQVYGPGGSLRRPIWVAPYIKGPEGAPLLTGEKVRALVGGQPHA